MDIKCELIKKMEGFEEEPGTYVFPYLGSMVKTRLSDDMLQACVNAAVLLADVFAGIACSGGFDGFGFCLQDADEQEWLDNLNLFRDRYISGEPRIKEAFERAFNLMDPEYGNGTKRFLKITLSNIAYQCAQEVALAREADGGAGDTAMVFADALLWPIAYLRGGSDDDNDWDYEEDAL